MKTYTLYLIFLLQGEVVEVQVDPVVHTDYDKCVEVGMAKADKLMEGLSEAAVITKCTANQTEPSTVAERMTI